MSVHHKLLILLCFVWKINQFLNYILCFVYCFCSSVSLVISFRSFCSKWRGKHILQAMCLRVYLCLFFFHSFVTHVSFSYLGVFLFSSIALRCANPGRHQHLNLYRMALHHTYQPIYGNVAQSWTDNQN